MRNLMLKIAYNGSRYHGWQVQKNAPTVCQTVQDAVEKALGQRFDLKGCSRTDAGVHANGFIASLRCEHTIPCAAAVTALNNLLPEDIAIRECREMPLEFHPRFDCTRKRYLYKIRCAQVRDPFLRGLVLEHPYPVDEALADAAARRFIGRHDFSAFCASGSEVKDHVRTVFDCRVTRAGELVTLSITGDGFLYNMVRIITGTVLYVCAGKLAESDIPAIIASRSRPLAGITAPACGLYLDEVFYD